jgi:DNA polymerase-4
MQMTVDGTAWVLHVDLDQFIAAVEVLRHPELAGKPVIVGGRGDPSERAVVSTASYEARMFGVGSGMPLRTAARKVPDAVILPVDAATYTAASNQVMATLRAQPGAVVQVLGWDEAFLGIATADPEAYARRVQQAVLEATALHCSVGIGDTLVRAKNATGFGKPRGVFRLTSDNWLEVMGARATIELWGVGTRISRRLATLGISTVAELATADEDKLVADAARELLAQVLEDVVADGRPVVGLGLKVRYAPFVTKTFTRKIPSTFDRDVVLGKAMELVEKIEPDRPVRLLGMRAEMAMPDDARKGHSPTRSGW